MDSHFPSDMKSVVLPPFSPVVKWSQVVEAWRDFSRVTDLENKSIRLLEKRLSETELRLT